MARCCAQSIRARWSRRSTLPLREHFPASKLCSRQRMFPASACWAMCVYDWPVMIAEGEETRYVGDALAVLAATTKEAARQAVELIEVEYEEREPLLSPAAALAEDAPSLHPKGNVLSTTVLKRGDAERAIAEAKHVVTHHYSTPRQEHGFLEPESALAVPTQCGSLTVYTAGQSVYDDHREIVRMLGIAGEKVRVISKFVGGGFGGKEDMSVQHHAALLAWHSGRPVKLTLSRDESSARPSQAPSHGNRLHYGMRREWQADRRARAPGGGYRRLRLAGRPSAATRLHARRGALSDRQRGHRRPRHLHQQHSFGRVPRLWRDANLLRHGEQSESARARSRHLSVGDALPQRHRAGRRALERPDRRRKARHSKKRCSPSKT